MTQSPTNLVSFRASDSAWFERPAKDRAASGKVLRKKVGRTSHAEWTAAARRSPIEILKVSDCGRVPELLPIRYGRMRQSPFAFFRGCAALMASDLAATPLTGIKVQACGDCHAANFGGFASPERELLFDINDFDETLPGPWEWDVKRLAASVVLGARELGLRGKQSAEAAVLMAESYRQHIREYSRMRALDVWYSHIEAKVLIEMAKSQTAKLRWRRIENKARLHTSEHILPEIATVENGRARLVDHPPLVYHCRSSELVHDHVADMFRRYKATLSADRRVIMDRYRIVDVARKVVGVGSVGTRCAVILLMSGRQDPLLLQIKQAFPSVLEPFAGKSRYENHAERVVTGQRMLQAASDVFLGWTRDAKGRDYYFRQLRDMKMKIDLANLTKADWIEYVQVCGWTLARAHARTGDAAMIAGYLGKSDAFASAIAKFAAKYADQVERDYALFLKAIREDQLPAFTHVA
jgi:uncharacterized protein (DUF2252 family)